jgi:5-methyltetrahydrofolate--homocysteine methyltransferase
MSIAFDSSRWQTIRTNYTRWWRGDLDRPLIHFTVHGYEPDRPPARTPLLKYQSFYDLSVPVEAIVDAIDYDLAGQRFLADAFPCTWLNFGPGVLATAIGDCDLFNGTDTVWYKPPHVQPIDQLRLAFNPQALWYRRIEALARAAVARWQGLVQVGMTDLGGTLDLVSSYRPGERLIFDLVDTPEEVEKRTWEAHEAWWQAVDRLQAAMSPANPGYTAWTPIFSVDPYYMLQCDFAYMIGPDMFEKFVKPELAASCRRLKNAFYHLDGVGQLPHLDSLLSIPELQGVQWIPGAGQPDQRHWPEVYRKIRAAGKLIQIHGDLDTLDTVANQLGSARGIILIGGTHRRNEDKVLAEIEKYGRL